MVKKLSNTEILIGIDQSARGTAAVCLENGKMKAVVFYADTKSSAKALIKRGALSPIDVKAGDEGLRTARLEHLKQSIRNFLELYKPKYVALEDYALARKAYAHSLGEVGGIIRLEIWRLGIPFRVYDVQAIKMFATGQGNAEKAEMILACRDRWEKHNFLEFGKTDGAAGNVADAYVIAQLLRTELRLRAGEIDLAEIPEEQRRVFTRTTKQKPVNILDLSFAKSG